MHTSSLVFFSFLDRISRSRYELIVLFLLIFFTSGGGDGKKPSRSLFVNFDLGLSFFAVLFAEWFVWLRYMIFKCLALIMLAL